MANFTESQLTAALAKLLQRGKPKITPIVNGLQVQQGQSNYKIPLQPQAGRKITPRFR